ncbi:MAG: hypothetical protein Q8R71_07810 [Phenylobacterium sp.]|nr:hypothetical protein [Phenylobacterium sp.]
MRGPPEAGLDDLRRQLTQLQSDVERLTAYGRAVASAVATLSPSAHTALARALGPEELGLKDERQSDLFDQAGRVQALGRSESALARDLERALVARAADLDGDEPQDERQRVSG